MKENFTSSSLEVNVSRCDDNTIRVEVGSDFAFSSRKSRLYVNDDKLRSQVEQFWKSIKTKKLLSMRVNFDPIDWYDDEVDVYETPIISIKRGLKKGVVNSRRHGSVPKDWGITATFSFADTTTNTPILEVIETLLGHKFPTQGKAQFIKDLKPLLRKETKYATFYNDANDDDE